MTDTPPPAASPAAGTSPSSVGADTGAGAAGPVLEVPPAGGQASASHASAGRARAGRWRGSTPRARGRRPRTRWRAAFFALAGLAIVVGIGWALLGNRVFVVRSVTVTGTHLLAPGRVIAAAGVPLGTPLLRVDAGTVTRRVEAIQQVASASVSKDWPDHLVIAVTERVPAMAVRMAGGYDLVDPSGVIVRQTKTLPAALPVFVTSLQGGALRGDPAVTAAAGVLAELEPWLARQVAEVRAVPVTAGPEQVTLNLRDGKTVQWGSADNAAQKNRELSILLPGKVHEIDVSAPGTVVTK
jgi:cell division protein FtsQ